VFELASIHNLHFYLQIIKEARAHIIAGDYGEWKAKTVEVISKQREIIKDF